MRRTGWLCVLLIAGVLHGQTIRWKAVASHRPLETRAWPATAPATKAEQARMLQAVLARKDGWCEPDDTSWTQDVRFTPQPLTPGHRDFLIEPGQGCNRGGQGANAAEWIVEMQGGRARVLGLFEGWLSHLEPATSHGLHDVVMGWHIGSCCYILSYYRYDGVQYHEVGSADVELDESGKSTVTPRKAKTP